jgi:hypothetical protein
MNSEDKKRFERYRKGYIPEDENTSSSNTNNTKIGYIDKININKNVLITDIITTNKSSKSKT